jgi:hypothetical protein
MTDSVGQSANFVEKLAGEPCRDLVLLWLTTAERRVGSGPDDYRYEDPDPCKILGRIRNIDKLMIYGTMLDEIVHNS